MEDGSDLFRTLRNRRWELEIQNTRLSMTLEEVRALEREFEELFTHAPCGYLILSPVGTVSRMSRKAEDLLGITNTALRDGAFGHAIAEEQRKEFFEALQRAAQTEEPQQVLFQPAERNLPEARWLQADVLADYEDDGTLRRWRVTLTDIDGIVDSRRILEEELENHKLLLKEFDHRVKNDLNMIASLLHIRNDELGERADLSCFVHQIEAIASLYRMQYGSQGSSRVNIREFIHDILHNIFSQHPGFVNIESRIEELSVDSRRALLLGLIINEIASHTIQHGFSPDTEAGFCCYVESVPEDGNLRLTVCSTGNLFPENGDTGRDMIHGLSFVNTLVKQLRGSIELEKEPVPRFSLTMPLS
jgi:two-component sensor histidine kinase